MPMSPDEEKAHRAVLKKLKGMTAEELFGLAVRAGIFTPDGELTEPYREPRTRRKKRARAKKK
jgi:hypothetical protein